MTTPQEPLPCPFCGRNDRLTISAVPNTNGNTEFVRCYHCEAHGPWQNRERERYQYERWNTRPTQPASASPATGEQRPYLATPELVNPTDIGAATPPQRYRPLEVGETIQEGDEVEMFRRGEWRRVGPSIGGHASIANAFRRPIPTPQPPEAQGTASVSAIEREVAREAELLILDMEGKAVRFRDEHERAIAWNVVRCRLHRERNTLADKQREATQARTTRREFQRLAKEKHEKDAAELAVALAQVESLKAERDEARMEMGRIIAGDCIPWGLFSNRPVSEFVLEHIKKLRTDRDALRGEVERLKETCGGLTAKERFNDQMAVRDILLRAGHNFGLAGTDFYAEAVIAELLALRADRDRITADLADSHKLLIQRAAELEQVKAELERYAGWSRWRAGLWLITHPESGHDATWIAEDVAALTAAHTEPKQ